MKKPAIGIVGRQAAFAVAAPASGLTASDPISDSQQSALISAIRLIAQMRQLYTQVSNDNVRSDQRQADALKQGKIFIRAWMDENWSDIQEGG